MRAFVSGATGVIGRRVVPLLLSQGHDVSAVARKAAVREGQKQAGARGVAVDLFDVDALKRAVAGHEAIINLATHMPSSTWMLSNRIARLSQRS